MSRLDQKVRMVSLGLAVLGMATVMALIMAGVLDALLRNTSGRSISGLVEATEILLVAAVYLPLAYAYRDDAHVSADVALSLFPQRWHRPIEVFGLTVAFAMLLPISYFAWNEAVDSIVSGEMRWGAIQLPLWPGRISVALGLTAFALELLNRLLSTIRAGRTLAETGLKQ